MVKFSTCAAFLFGRAFISAGQVLVNFVGYTLSPRYFATYPTSSHPLVVYPYSLILLLTMHVPTRVTGSLERSDDKNVGDMKYSSRLKLKKCIPGATILSDRSVVLGLAAIILSCISSIHFWYAPEGWLWSLAVSFYTMYTLR